MAIDIRQLSRQYAEEFWGKGNTSMLEQVCDPTRYKLHDSIEGELDVEGTKKNMMAFRNAFPDMRVNAVDIIVEGNKAAMHWEWSGTFRKALYGIEPNNKTITLQGVSYLHFENEKLVEEYQHFDAYGMFQKMGVVPRLEDLSSQRPEQRM